VELTNEFVVAAPPEIAWELLTDIERIAPCVPGFELTEQAGDEFRGTMKVKVGAIGAKYDVAVRFVDRDDAAHRLVMEAKGKELKGQGLVSATITASVVAEGEVTRATTVTDLTVTGRVAQFGRGILADVSNRIVKQFVGRLETLLVEGPPQELEAQIAAPPSVSPDVRRIQMAPAEPVNLVAVAGAPALKRIAPLAFIALLAGIVLFRRARS
jgi:carbon monoxide dehydrogenase subunit G